MNSSADRLKRSREFEVWLCAHLIIALSVYFVSSQISSIFYKIFSYNTTLSNHSLFVFASLAIIFCLIVILRWLFPGSLLIKFMLLKDPVIPVVYLTRYQWWAFGLFSQFGLPILIIIFGLRATIEPGVMLMFVFWAICRLAWADLQWKKHGRTLPGRSGF